MINVNTINTKTLLNGVQGASSVQAGYGVNSGELEKAARQVEEVFVNEMLKTMLENTELAKTSGVSEFLPVITSELSKSICERGVGVQDFFMRSPAFNMMIEKSKGRGAKALDPGTGVGLNSPARGMKIKAYEAILQD